MNSAVPTRQNVLLLLTDQERYDVLDDAGSAVRTPNLDRLVRDGVAFFPGLHADQHLFERPGVAVERPRSTQPRDAQQLSRGRRHPREPAAEIVTFGELLRERGYENTYLGKWHVGRDQGPEDFGFSYLGGSDSHHDASRDSGFREYRERLGGGSDTDHVTEPIYADTAREPTLIAGTADVPTGATRPYYLAERTIDRLAELADAREPFFHRTDFLGPHHPYVVPEPYASMYDPDGIEPWPSFRETYAGKPRVQEQYLSYRGVADFDRDRWSEIVAKYLGFVTLIDEQIGRIVDALDEHGLTDSTAVVHTSDHGDFVGAHRQFNKGQMMYDDTYRVPLVVRWPDVVPSGTVRRELVSLVDLMPTFVELAGGTVPDHVDGRSLLPLLSGDAPRWRSAVFAEYHGDEFGLYSQRMVRTEEYKFVFNAPDEDELYDLTRDPDELQNLIHHPAFDSVRRRLEATLLRKMEATDDPLYAWTATHLGR